MLIAVYSTKTHGYSVCTVWDIQFGIDTFAEDIQ